MFLSMNTDYASDHGTPEPYLRQIAAAGFSHLHWVHHWKGDHIYSQYEIEQIGRWLEKYGLLLNDLHASEGNEKFWLSGEEYARRSGVELVQNRIEMTAVLGGDAIVLHLPAEPNGENNVRYWTRLHKSLDELLPHVQRSAENFGKSGVRIALENNFRISNHAPLKRILAEYSPNEIGICYDSGHGNIMGDGLDFLEEVKDRLLVLHLNDNDGSGDQHKLIFTATVDWARLAQLVATSSYDKPLGMEVVMRNMRIDDAPTFLAQAMATCTKFAEMVEVRRTSQVVVP